MLRSRTHVAVLVSLGLWLAAGCSESEPAVEPEPAAAPAPAPAPIPGGDAVAAQAEAEKIFAERCVTCHGASGAGDGPASAGLTPKPRNFQDTAWQQTVSDEYIEQIIQYGGAAVGRSPAMPGNPDLGGKPAVLAELRVQIRALAK